MSIGHFVGVGSEFITRSLCKAAVNNDAYCSILALVVHEAVVEPIVDGTIYASISSYQKGFDIYEFTVKAASSFGAGKASEYVLGESIVTSTVAGVAGGYIAGELWESMYPSNHTHEDL